MQEFSRFMGSELAKQELAKSSESEAEAVCCVLVQQVEAGRRESVLDLNWACGLLAWRAGPSATACFSQQVAQLWQDQLLHRQGHRCR